MPRPKIRITEVRPQGVDNGRAWATKPSITWETKLLSAGAAASSRHVTCRVSWMTGTPGTEEASGEVPGGEEKPYSDCHYSAPVPGKATLLHRFLPGEESINLLVSGLIFLISPVVEDAALFLGTREYCNCTN